MADEVDYDIGLSYRPVRLHNLAGRYDNPMPSSTLSPQIGTINLAPGLFYWSLAHTGGNKGNP